MELKENLQNQLDKKLADLFEQAHRDPELKRELLRNPRAVAEKFNVKLDDEEVQNLQKLGALTELADDIKLGRLYPRPPIYYPIHIWQIKELVDIFSHLISAETITPSGPIFYPAPDFGQQVMFAARAYRPQWVTYPGDGDSGGGSGVGGGIHGGGVVPGPIFYPAGLRRLMIERLVQILQVKQQQFTR